MKVTILKRISFEELEQLLRQVPLKGRDSSGNQIFPYATARISSKSFYADEVNPSTFYLLKSGLERQRELRSSLMDQYGIDTLCLDGALHFRVEGEDILEHEREKMLIPPIIEFTPRFIVYQPQSGEIDYSEIVVKAYIPLINDGAHRAFLAKELGIPFNVAFISQSSEEYSFYAHANSWGNVRVVDEVPAGKEDKKLYRLPDCYAVYRDFGILGCGDPRKAGAKS